MNVLYLSFQRLKAVGVFVALVFSSAGLWANECGTATAMTTGSSYTLTIDGFCNYSPPAQNICNSCMGDAWFRWVPGGTNALQQDVTFDVLPNFNGTISVSILYSESFEGSGDPCEWNGTTEGYTQYTALCSQAVTAGTSIQIRHTGLDGSGEYFLLVERTDNTGGNVTVTPTLNGTCAQPSNDRCSTPTALGSGNGIDPNAGLAIPPTTSNWAFAFSASTKCATKQRLTNTCGAFTAPNPPTEDHYGRKIGPACLYNGNLGQTASIPFGSQCDEFLENTVYYSFQVPTYANDWVIHFSSYAPCLTTPNNMVAMLFSSLDCSDADNSVLLECGKFNVFGNLNTPPYNSDLIFDDGGTGHELFAGNTYYIVLDGTRGSQCDIEILVTRDATTLVLPVKVTNFNGINQQWTNTLSWEAENAQELDYFEIQRSEDAQTFDPIGLVRENDQQSLRYDFQDKNAEVGINYYRIKAVDINGVESYSEVLGVLRENDGIEIRDVYPIPVKDNLFITFATAEAGKVSLKLIDLTGREVFHSERMVEKGNNQWNIPSGNLAKGMYLLQLSQNGKTEIRKVRK